MKNTNGINASLFWIISYFVGENCITIESTKAISNKAAPYSEPNGMSAVEDDELEPATMAVIISGAPLAKARKVTPANAWDISLIFHNLLNF